MAQLGYRPDHSVCGRRRLMMAADRVIRWTTAAGVVGASAVAALAANVVQGLGHGLTGASVAARPAVVVGSNELLMLIISSVQGQVGEPDASGEPDRELDADPLQARAAQMFTLDLAAGMRALGACSLRAASCRPASRAAGKGLPGPLPTSGRQVLPESARQKGTGFRFGAVAARRGMVATPAANVARGVAVCGHLGCGKLGWTQALMKRAYACVPSPRFKGGRAVPSLVAGQVSGGLGVPDDRVRIGG
jgi:hypothetical protein